MLVDFPLVIIRMLIGLPYDLLWVEGLGAG